MRLNSEEEPPIITCDVARPNVDLSLSRSLVASSIAPLLLLDKNLVILGISRSFCREFGIEGSVTGQFLCELGSGEWVVPQLQALLRATAGGGDEVEGYEMDLVRQGQAVRRLIVNAQKLDYSDAQVRVLLTVTDVTEVRRSHLLKDDLLREKVVLLQELQHRVANGLQLIASVLLMSARRVQSDETRGHLYAAHNRLMSLATVQKQLAATRLGNVQLRPYFTDLCHSLGASMIHDADQLSLTVSSTESEATAEVALNLGLIVTELVINALKHAFPGNRKGAITVDYSAVGRTWALAVGDHGIGSPVNDEHTKPGLGTSIVKALSIQLGAEVCVSDAKPGTLVTINKFGIPASYPAAA